MDHPGSMNSVDSSGDLMTKPHCESNGKPVRPRICFKVAIREEAGGNVADIARENYVSVQDRDNEIAAELFEVPRFVP
ncbi:hypothetical protein WJX64_06910 [Leifsonia sp. YIM 134122]|uniref:Uncharacterized protein n=1 Tax=Leifsonia stereocauli TaxID=3134136 RepID=A0ABU9W2P2_9MICO